MFDENNGVRGTVLLAGDTTVVAKGERRSRSFFAG